MIYVIVQDPTKRATQATTKKTKHNNRKVKIQKQIQQTLQDLMTIKQHGRVATTRDVLGGNKLGAKLPSE